MLHFFFAACEHAFAHCDLQSCLKGQAPCRAATCAAITPANCSEMTNVEFFCVSENHETGWFFGLASIMLFKYHRTYYKKCFLFYVAQGGSEEEEAAAAATSVGDRQANIWLQYDSSNLPVTEEQWQSLQFVEKTHWGYYCWPR